MKKKVFLGIILILVLIFSSVAYATVEKPGIKTVENTIVNTTVNNTANTVINTDLIDNTVPSSEDGIMPISETSDETPVGEDGSYVIPEEWRRTTETDETEEGNEDYSIPEEWLRTGEQKQIDNSYAEAGEDVNVENLMIDGSLFVAGSNVNVKNVTVYGDVFVAGENITFTDVAVVGSLFSAGSNVNMTNTEVGVNIFNASGSFSFTGGASDIFAFATRMMFNKGSIIYRDVYGFGSNIEFVGTTVERNANISTDSLKISEASSISGELNYYAKEEAEISADSIVSNPEFTKTETPTETYEISKPKTIAFDIVSIIIKSAVVCGLICFCFKGFAERQKSDKPVKRIAVSTLKGLLWAIVIPVVAMLLLFTGVTFGLSFIVMALYFIIFIISVPIVSTAVAVAICKDSELSSKKIFGYSLVVALVIAILKQIPQINVVVTILVGLAGMGIVMASIRGPKASKKEENPVVETVETTDVAETTESKESGETTQSSEPEKTDEN